MAGLAADPLSTTTLTPEDFSDAVRLITHTFAFPAGRIALGLEGGYSLSTDAGMPAALVSTCRALASREGVGS